MLRALKWLIYINLAAAIAVALLVIVVLFVVDPNAYRGHIEQAVETRTGRALNIEGDLGLSFYPLFGIELGRTRLAEAEGFGDAPFVEVDRAQLAVQLIPLLSGELRLETVLLERPRVNLIRLEDGRANWETLTPATDERIDPEQARRAAEIAREQGVGVEVPQLLREARLSGVDMREARILFEDRAANTEVVVDPLDLTLEDVRLGAPVPLRASWRLAQADERALEGSLETVVRISEDLSTASATGVDLTLTLIGEGIPAGRQTLQLGGDVEAQPLAGRFRVSDLGVSAAGLELAGQADIDTGPDGPEGEARLSLAEADPRAVMEALEIAPPEPRDDSVLRSLEAEADIRFANGGMEIGELRMRLDDSRLSGRAGMRSAASPRFTFAVQVDQIDVDRYLPPPRPEDEPPTPEDEEDEGEDPLALIRSLDLEGQLQIGRLIVAGAEASDVSLNVTAGNGEVRIHPLTANLYQGRYSGDLTLDASGDAPRLRVDERLTGIQAEPLLGALAEFDRLLGTGDFAISATGQGLDADSLLASLDGEARFEFTDGAIRGINIARMIREGAARLRGQSVAPEDAPRRTDFSSLKGTLTLADGQVRNDDLEMLTPLLRITGAGGANLVERSVDYSLGVNVVGTLEGQGGQELEQLRRVPIPLRFRGALLSPDISLDLAEAFQDIAGERLTEERERAEQRLREEGERARERLEERIDDELGDSLRRFLRQ